MLTSDGTLSEDVQRPVQDTVSFTVVCWVRDYHLLYPEGLYSLLFFFFFFHFAIILRARVINCGVSVGYVIKVKS